MLKIYCSPVRADNGSATVYSLLEYAYIKEYGGKMPDIEKTPNGKPFFPARQDVHFSLSHASTHVLCAISDNDVGVDIEAQRHISERAVRFFSAPEELLLFEPLDLWVLKESYIKLIGGTLMLVKSIRFQYENGRIITADKVAFSQLYNIANCRAAVSTYCGFFPDSVELV